MKLWLLCIASGISLSLSTIGASAQEEDSSGENSAMANQQATEERSVRRLGDVIGEGSSEFSMDIPQMDIPTAPVSEQPEVSLPDQALDNRLQNILARRAYDPNSPEIEQELASLLDDVEAETRQALAAGDLELATRYANVIAEFDSERSVVSEVGAEVERAAEIGRLLGLADEALESGNLVTPTDVSAWSLYQRSIAIDSDNERAVAGLSAVREQLLTRIDELIDESDFEDAETLLARAEGMQFEEQALTERRENMVTARENKERALINETRQAIDQGDFDRAEDLVNQMIGMGVDQSQVDRLRSSLDDAVRYSGYEPGQLIQDGLGGDEDLYGPVMVVMPSGSFMMGSPESEDERSENEGPQFRVTFERGFALSRSEITVGQFRRFVEATGYETDAERRGTSRVYMFGTGRVAERRRVTWEDDYLGDRADESLPVIHVSWNDATAYANWLAEATDRPYRLPTEAEFEYALRAGSQSPYWWGNGSPDDVVENVTGDGDRFTDGRQWNLAFRRYDDGYWGPAPAGSLAANAFELFDMGGNVMEWVQDCWHDSYVRAPSDGSAWVNPGCGGRVIRGASWNSSPPMSRSAFRISSQQTATDARVGFRVARDL